eukprot:1796595-Prymnesium_polylepis.1
MPHAAGANPATRWRRWRRWRWWQRERALNPTSILVDVVEAQVRAEQLGQLLLARILGEGEPQLARLPPQLAG